MRYLNKAYFSAVKVRSNQKKYYVYCVNNSNVHHKNMANLTLQPRVTEISFYFIQKISTFRNMNAVYYYKENMKRGKKQEPCAELCITFFF